MNLTIDPKNLPPDGLHLQGELPPGVFELSPEDIVRPISPLSFDLTVIKMDSEGDDDKEDEECLLVTGQIAASFDLECGRCTERFQQRVAFEKYAQEIPLENESTPDLTTWLREDILLALPTYPRCETGNVTPRQCPAEGRFDSPSELSEDEAAQAQDRKTWEALDQLTNLKKN